VSVSGFLTFKAEELGYHPEVSWRWRPARPQDQRRDGQVRGREHGQGDDPRRAKRTRKTIKGPPIFLGVWPEFDFRPADVLDCHLEREFMGRARRTPHLPGATPGGRFDRFVLAWNQATREEADHLATLRSKAFREAKALSKILGEKFGAQRVALFGSVLDPDRFREDSDIDLAVTGLPQGSFFRAYGYLLMRSAFPIDLKPWESLTPSLRCQVAKGRSLYDKKAKNP